MTLKRDKIDLFLEVLNHCVVREWYNANGWSIGDDDVIEELEGPELTFSMVSAGDYPDDETAMIVAIHEDLESRVAPTPINLHMHPGMFYVGHSVDKKDMHVVRIENPTMINVFKEVEAYYRSLGCPETDKRFVEGVYHPDSTWTAEDRVVLLGS